MDLTSVVGVRGLIIFDEDSTFKVVPEDKWRKLQPYSAVAPSQSSDPVRTLIQLKAAFALLDSKSAFVDFDKLAELPTTPGMTGSASASQQSGPVALAGQSVVIREGNNVFVVKKDQWEDVDQEIAGDARVLVNRGALVAAIPPSPIPQGTFCVLVNFVGLSDT